MVTRILARFRHALSGLGYALRTDRSFKIHVYSGLLLGSVLAWFLYPLALSEILFLTVGWCMILITELQNSAIEAALDRLHPEEHDAIKRSKDMAAAAVLIAGLFLLLVLCVVLYSHTLAS